MAVTLTGKPDPDKTIVCPCGLKGQQVYLAIECKVMSESETSFPMWFIPIKGETLPTHNHNDIVLAAAQIIYSIQFNKGFTIRKLTEKGVPPELSRWDHIIQEQDE